MDTSLIKLTHDRSLDLLNRHRLFRHRFESAYEFNHIVHEFNALESDSPQETRIRLLKAGIDIRKRLLEKVELAASSSVNQHESASNDSIILQVADNITEDPSTATSSAPVAQSSFSVSRAPIDITFLEFQLHHEVLSSMEDLIIGLSQQKSQKERINELKAKRDALALEVKELEASLPSSPSPTGLETTIASLSIQERRLSRRKDELVEPLARLVNDWDASEGSEIAYSRALILRSAMEARNASLTWATIEKEHVPAIYFLLRAGVLRVNPSNINQVQLRI